MLSRCFEILLFLSLSVLQNIAFGENKGSHGIPFSSTSFILVHSKEMKRVFQSPKSCSEKGACALPPRCAHPNPSPQKIPSSPSQIAPGSAPTWVCSPESSADVFTNINLVLFEYALTAFPQAGLWGLHRTVLRIKERNGN